MFKNYVKTAFRSLKKQASVSLINIVGLTLAIASCVIIISYVTYELSYDNYHKDRDRIYRIALDINLPTYQNTFAPISYFMAPYLKQNFAQVEKVARIYKRGSLIVRINDKVFYEPDVVQADNEIFDVLTLPFINGSPGTALTRPGSVVISESIGHKYFGDSNPLGQTIQIDTTEFLITGVMADIPGNSHLGFEFIASMFDSELPGYTRQHWQTLVFHTYVKFREGTDTEKLIRLIEAGANKERASHIKKGDKYTYILQPLKDIHLHSDISGEFKRPGNPVYLTIFGVIAGFILLIACINYINLSTAQFTLRNKEVFLRKVVGAGRRSLITQFFCETILIVFISGILAYIIILFTLPYFMNMAVAFSSLNDLGSIKILYVLAGIILLTGLIAGSYPAFFLSSRKPVNIIKSEHGAVPGGRIIKRVMVVGQYIISFILMSLTIVIFQQIHYMENKDLGFKKEQKIVMPVRTGADLNDNYNIVKAEFLRDPMILDAVVSSGVPGRSILISGTSLVNEAEDMKQPMMYLFVDNDYLSAYGITLCAGRAFRKGRISDKIREVIINETAVNCFGWAKPEEALGKIVKGYGGKDEAEIIGVARDFHYDGLRTRIEPLLISNSRADTYSYLTLTLAGADNIQILSSVENTWTRLFPGVPFDYYYLDTDFDRFYTEEFTAIRLVSIFSLLAIVITCLGILGLVIHITQNRKKEIGIRKVIGASEKRITLLLTSEFLYCIIVAILLASPVAFTIMDRWLEGYAYSINFSLWFLLLPAIIIISLTFLTVSYHTIKAARANPVDSLRHE